jgi:ATP/maltotriose-dependent transcriptional regulator MalT
LFISLQTVKDHTHRIYSKIGIRSRMQLVQLVN